MAREEDQRPLPRLHRQVYPYFRPKDDPIPSLGVSEKLRIVSIKLHEGKTKPPNRLTETELLKLMEENAIGTDATRATYPKLIIDRGYAVKERRVFKPTELGMRLIELLEDLDERIVTPETRRRVEKLMAEIEAGKIGYDEALEKVASEYLPLYRELENRLQLSSLEDIREVKRALENAKLEVAIVKPPRQLTLTGLPQESLKRFDKLTPAKLLKLLESGALYDEIVGEELAFFIIFNAMVVQEALASFGQ